MPIISTRARASEFVSPFRCSLLYMGDVFIAGEQAESLMISRPGIYAII
jgi:hypothetical protein